MKNIRKTFLTISLVSLSFMKLNCKCTMKKAGGSAILSNKIISVEEAVIAPGRYEGFLSIQGLVVNVDKTKGVFGLGCEDACIAMPVKFKGQMPAVKSEVIVYGEIKKQEDGRYAFEGKEVKTK